MELLSVLIEKKDYLGVYYYLFRLQCLSGCRVSEALSVLSGDVAVNGSILIRGLKGSDDRVFYDSEIALFAINRSKQLKELFYGCNRFSAYRHLKNIGIGTQKKGRERMSITHIFRNEYIKLSKSLTTDARVIANSVGHKSVKSQEYYE